MDESWKFPAWTKEIQNLKLAVCQQNIFDFKFKWLTLCLLESSADNLYKTFLTQIRPDKALGLIWIQTVWHSDGIPEKVFLKVDFEKKKSANDKKHEKLPHMQSCLQTIWN